MVSLSLDPTQPLPAEYLDEVMTTLGVSSYLLSSPCQQGSYPFLAKANNWNSGIKNLHSFSTGLNKQNF